GPRADGDARKEARRPQPSASRCPEPIRAGTLPRQLESSATLRCLLSGPATSGVTSSRFHKKHGTERLRPLYSPKSLWLDRVTPHPVWTPRAREPPPRARTAEAFSLEARGPRGGL